MTSGSIWPAHATLRPGAGASFARAVFLACAVGLTFAASASAVSRPVALGPDSGALPAVAVDSSGTAYIAWANHTTLKDINFCRMPVGATSCTPVEIPVPSGPAQIGFSDPPSVQLAGGNVYVFEDVSGGTADQDGMDEFVSSTDPISFTQVTPPLSYNGFGDAGALLLPNGLVGVPYVGVQSYPMFQANTLVSPADDSAATYPTPYATLGGTDYTAEDIGNLKAAWTVQQSGPSEGVLGVAETESIGPACPSDSHSGLAYVYAPITAATTAAGLNTSTGQTGSPWAPIAPADCDGTDPALAGGPSGLGMVEVDYATNTFVYRAFNPATGFGAAVPIASGATYDGLAQDSNGGIYTVFNNNGTELAYSANGGKTFIGPNVLDATAGENLAMAVGSDGEGWVVFDSGGTTEYAQPFDAADAIPPPVTTTLTTSQISGSQHSANISILGGTTGETDTATLSGANTSFAGGTVRYDLYASKTCDPGTAEVFNGGASTVTDGIVAASQPVTAALSPGTYYWQAVYSGDASNDPSTSACGSETLTVTAPATPAPSGTSTAGGLSFSITCNAASECAGTTSLMLGGIGSAADATAARALVLGSATFKIKAHHSKTITIKLKGKARSTVAHDHGRFTATATLSETVDGHKVTSSRQIKFKPGHTKG